MRRAHARGWPAVAAGLVLLSGVSCTGGGRDDAAAPDDGRPLVVVSGADLTGENGRGARQELIDLWNRAHPDRPAVLEELPQAEDGQRSELIASLQSGDASYDVLNLDVTWIPEFAKAGLIRPLDDSLVAAGFLDQAVAASRWEGETYAVPFNTDVGLLYYRRDLLREQGGRDPEELARADSLAELVGGWGSGNDQPAYVTQLRPYEGLTVNTMEAFWSAGGEDATLVDEDGDYVGSVAELADGLTALADIASDDEVLSEVSYEADETTALAEFTDARGGTAMMRGWPYMFRQLPTNGEYGVTTLPGVAALGGQSLAVSADSDRLSDAEDLIRFLTADVENQRHLLEAGFAPALRDAYDLADPDGPTCGPRTVSLPASEDDSDDAATGRGAGAGGDGDDDGGDGGDGDRAFRELLWCALVDARPRPTTEYYAAFSETLRDQVAMMLDDDHHDLSPDEAAEVLDATLPDALAGRVPDHPDRDDAG